jgi:uncharacterized cofD-like protein
MSGSTTTTRPIQRSESEEHPSDAPMLRVVAIGGGTGLSTLLRGLKQHTLQTASGVIATELASVIYSGPERRQQSTKTEPQKRAADHLWITDLSAVVTVTDDGGSSGRLRKEFNILPPGDIRNCLVALSEDEALLSRLFQYRFKAGEGLEGHSFGNLFLTALNNITGDFAEAVRESSIILATRGQIFPATTSDVQLTALMDDDSEVSGETKITASKRRIIRLKMVPANATPLPQTLEAIQKADLITIGPGSLFTSLITNVLVHGIPEAIASSNAVKVFICNLMTQANESLNLTASEHINKIYEHAGMPIFDYALVNTGKISEELQAKYAEEGAAPIELDKKAIEALGVKCITGNFVDEGDVVRHNTNRLAKELHGIVLKRP